MAIQFLDERPSFGQQFARSLSAGLGQGLSQASQFAQTMAMEKAKNQLRQDRINAIHQHFHPSSRGQSETANKLAGKPDSTVQTSNKPTKEDISIDDPYAEAEAYAAAKEDALANIYARKAQEESRQRFKRESGGEKELNEIEDRLQASELQDFRFGRLEELFSPQNDEKFPSAVAAGLFTKGGDLNPAYSGTLTPEAQEAVKLVVDNLKGIKETLGSQISAMEVSTYLKTLPSLLNTAEGRRKILRDLRLMNQVNREFDEGTLNYIYDHGGPSQISVATAKRMFKKQFAPRLGELKKEFMKPSQKTMNELPDAAKHAGKKIRDTENNQILVSDGKEWMPQEE